MRRFKKILTVFLILLLVILAGGFWYAWHAFPAVSGYGAKDMCSAIYLQHRNPSDITKDYQDEFPLSIGEFTWNQKDSSVTGSVWGFAKRKAIYRQFIGCTLVNDFTENEIRAQHFDKPTAPEINSDTVAWPYGDKLNESFPAELNKSLLDKAVDNVLNETKDDKPVYTRAVLVVYNGQIVAEKYAPGFDKHTVMLGWSMSKSLTAALIGILVKQGKLSVNDPAPVPEWKDNKKEAIKLLHLLQQTSGLDFKENYSWPSEVTDMLFNKGDMAAYTAALPLKYEPGKVFNYSSGNSNILSRIIRNTVGENEYTGFPYRALFHKINAYSFLLEPDASGTYIGSSYSYATARDFARFGLLYYNNGWWNGEQILPGNWVEESIQPSAADRQKKYGYQFWLNGYQEKDSTKHLYPDVPGDMYNADGYGGQDVYIIPSKKLVVVRLGLHKINENKFLKEVIASLK